MSNRNVELNAIADEYEVIAGCVRKLALLDEKQRVRVIRALDSMLVQRMIEPLTPDVIRCLESAKQSGGRSFTAQEERAIDTALKILSRQVVGHE